MGTRFTRVTVVADPALGRQVDVSLPADVAVAEQVPPLLRLLSVPSTATPVRWTLSTPELGPIARDRSLDDVGVLDGTVLYLTPAAEAAEPPFVDDVERAAATVVEDVAPAFGDAARRGALGILVAIVLAAALVVTAIAPAPVSWVGAAAIATFALLVGRMIAEPGGAVAALAAVPASGIVVIGVLSSARAGMPGWAIPAVVGAGAVGLAVGGMVRADRGWVAGGLTATALCGVAVLARALGLQTDRVAGLVLLGAVIAVGLAGQLALGGAGLINLMVADEDGDRVLRDTVVSSVRRGQAIATGVVWACAVGAGIVDAVLVLAPGSGTPGWIGRVLGGLGGVIFALRARMFTRARQVLPMLAAAVATGAVLAVAAPTWWSASATVRAVLALALLALVLAVVVGAGMASLSAVPRARLRRVFEILDVAAVLALVPLLVLLFSAIPAMQRWLG